MTGVSQPGMSAADVLLRAWFTYPPLSRDGHWKGKAPGLQNISATAGLSNSDSYSGELSVTKGPLE